MMKEKHYMIDFDITMVALIEKLLEAELQKEGYENGNKTSS